MARSSARSAPGSGWLPSAGLFLRVPEADDDRVLGADEGRAALYVADRWRPVAGDQREVHGRRFARGLGRRLVEVGVTVEEQEPGAITAAQRERPAEQHTAIAAEDERHVAGVDHFPDRVGEGDRVCDHLGPIEHATRRVAHPGAGRGATVVAVRASSASAKPCPSSASPSPSTPAARSPSPEGARTTAARGAAWGGSGMDPRASHAPPSAGGDASPRERARAPMSTRPIPAGLALPTLVVALPAARSV